MLQLRLQLHLIFSTQPLGVKGLAERKVAAQRDERRCVILQSRESSSVDAEAWCVYDIEDGKTPVLQLAALCCF